MSAQNVTKDLEIIWDDPNLDFGTHSDSGVIGDARQASAELGRRLWTETVDWVTEYLAHIAER